MGISIIKDIEKDIPTILEILYELERPMPFDEKEIKVFKKKIKDYVIDSQKTI